MKLFRQLSLALAASTLFLLSQFAHAQNPVVVLQTSLGDITLELYPEQAPVTVKNFLAYVDSGFYEGTIFHRVIPRFMVQGGGFDQDMVLKPTAAPIVNEAKNRLHNERGTVAMARTSDPDSASSQFFINLTMNMSLDWSPDQAGYAVFGRVIDGMDVVDAMVLEPTGRVDMHDDVPVEPIILKKAVHQPGK